jgi:hypothetical protein
MADLFPAAEVVHHEDNRHHDQQNQVNADAFAEKHAQQQNNTTE